MPSYDLFWKNFRVLDDNVTFSNFKMVKIANSVCNILNIILAIY